MSSLLDRDQAVAVAKPLIDKYSPYLKDICDYALNLLMRCEKSTKGSGGTPLSLITLYYSAIRTTDGIEALCSQSCFVASMPLLRSLMEAEYSIEYILEDYEYRSSAWLVGYYLERLRYLDTLDANTSRGRDFREAHAQDRMAADVDLSVIDPALIEIDRKQIKEILAKKKFSGVIKDFEKMKGSRKWYKVGGGPATMWELADHLHRRLDYEINYRDYSAVVHADAASRMLEAVEGKLAIVPLRSAIPEAKTLLIFAGGRLMSISLRMAEKFRPQEMVREQLKKIMRQHRPELFTKS